MKSESKRWFVLAMGILANMCMGAAYASSVFAKPLLIQLGLMKNGAPDMVQWAMAFSINLACLPLGMLLSGKITDIKSPRVVVVGGGLLFGIGMLLTGYATSAMMVFGFFGVMMGIGSGAAYGAVVSTAVRWFPDKRGLAGGLAVGALGIGTLVIAPIAHKLMQTAPDSQVPVLWAFKVLGITFIIIIALASFFLNSPPADYKPEGWEPKKGAAGTAGQDFNWKQLFGRLDFWFLYAMYACGCFSGLMLISQASPIAQKMTKLTAQQAVTVVASMGLANALGRVFWGFISDKIGRLNSLLAMFAVTALTMFIMPQLAAQQATLLIGVVLVGACFGGYLGIFPSMTADYFGAKNLAVNYAVVFSAFSVAAILGPKTAGKIVLSTNSYAQAFVIAGIVCVVGAALTIAEKVRYGAKKKTDDDLQASQSA